MQLTIFVTEASQKVGFGHLMECLAVADSISELSDSIFYLQDSDSRAHQILNNKNYSYKSSLDDLLKKKILPDCILLNTRHNHYKLQEDLCELSPHFIIWDELGNKKVHCHTLINSSLCNDWHNYSYGEVKPDFFLGPNYFPLRKKIIDIKGKILSSRDVLVTLGGADRSRTTIRIAKLIGKINDISCTYVIGPGCNIDKHVIETIISGNSNQKVVVAPDDFDQLLAMHDTIISSGGNTLYEAAYLDKNILIVWEDKHEHEQGRVFQENGFAIVVGGPDHLDKKTIIDFFSGKGTKKNAAKNLCIDGKGIKRINNIILREVILKSDSSKKTDENSIRTNNSINKKSMLDVYSRFSPSVRKTDSRFSQLRHSLFLNRLKLPLQLFKDSHILEFGPGTGETSIHYALWGASSIDLVEINPISVKQLKQKFEENSFTNILKNIHEIDFEKFETTNSYDFVCAEGCLYLADNPEKAFEKLVQNLKPGGFVVCAIPETMGHFQEFFKRSILWTLSKGNEGLIVKYAKVFFGEALKRASLAGGRPIDNIIYDKYINPIARSIPCDTVMKWFNNNNINYYSSTPDLLSFHLNDTHYQNPIDLTSLPARDLLGLSKMFLLKTKEYDVERVKLKQKELTKLNVLIKKIEDQTSTLNLKSIQNIDLNQLRYELEQIEMLNLNDVFTQETNIEETFKTFIEEILNIIKIIENDLDSSSIEKIAKIVNSYEFLFKGFNGNPSQYYVGYKSKDNCLNVNNVTECR